VGFGTNVEPDFGSSEDHLEEKAELMFLTNYPNDKDGYAVAYANSSFLENHSGLSKRLAYSLKFKIQLMNRYHQEVGWPSCLDGPTLIFDETISKYCFNLGY